MGKALRSFDIRCRSKCLVTCFVPFEMSVGASPSTFGPLVTSRTEEIIGYIELYPGGREDSTQ